MNITNLTPSSIDGTGAVNLTKTAATTPRAATPDGKRIVFASNRHAYTETADARRSRRSSTGKSPSWTST